MVATPRPTNGAMSSLTSHRTGYEQPYEREHKTLTCSISVGLAAPEPAQRPAITIAGHSNGQAPEYLPTAITIVDDVYESILLRHLSIAE